MCYICWWISLNDYKKHVTCTGNIARSLAFINLALRGLGNVKVGSLIDKLIEIKFVYNYTVMTIVYVIIILLCRQVE